MTTTDQLEAHRRLLRLNVLRSELRELWSVFLRSRSSRGNRVDVESHLKGIERDAVALGIDQERFRNVLTPTVKSLRQYSEFEALLKNAHSVVAPLIELVDAPIKEQTAVVAAEPASLEKAKRHLRCYLEEIGPFERACEVVALLAEELPSSVIDALEHAWREERDRHGPNPVSEVFWSSSLEASDWDMCARYRAWERFEFPGFDRAFAQVESEYEEVVAGLSCSVHETRTAAYGLWHATRSKRMINRLAGTLTGAFQRVVDAQQADGSWHLLRLDGPRRRRKGYRPLSVPDSLATALLCAALLRGSESERAREAAVRGARWLMSRQKPNGSWIDTESGRRESDFFITAVALDAIGRTDLPGAARSIKSGQAWLLTKQTSCGGWEDDGLPWPVAAVLALEAFEAGKRLSRGRDQYATASVGLVSRASQLGREDTPTSRRLAVVAAAHAVEAFLYSVLSLPSINANIWADKGQTIGMRAALTLLQGHLQTRKMLRPNELIAHRAALETLQYGRDQVVHKAANISSEECIAGVKAAQAFITKYSTQLLGFNLLD